MHREPLLSVMDVSKSFEGIRALSGVSIQVKAGEVSLIIGPNGSGKSTLVNLIFGLFRPDSGRVIFDSSDITGKPPHVVYSKGLVRTFQVPAPFPSMTVMENMLVADRGMTGESFVWGVFESRWKSRQLEAEERASGILNIIRLARLSDSKASELSGGQLKLLEIGRAIMAEPRMLVMDEPVGGVNQTLAHEIFARIGELRKEFGTTFLFIEHRLDVALRYADYVHVMSKGRVICKGSVSEVTTNEEVIKVYLGVN